MVEIEVPKNIPGIDLNTQDSFPRPEIYPRTEDYGDQQPLSRETEYSTFTLTISTLEQSTLSSSASFCTAGGATPPWPGTR